MFHTPPVRPVSASQRAQFRPGPSGCGPQAAPPGLAQSAQILARLAHEQPRGRLTWSHIVTVARNAQGRYPADMQAAAAQFHAQRHVVRAAFEARQAGRAAGAHAYGGVVRGYRASDLQALAGAFAGQPAPRVAANGGPAFAPAYGRPGAHAGAAGMRVGDAVDEALCRLGHYMQRTQRAFLSVERLIAMERSGFVAARQALDNLARWGQAVGMVMEHRARLLLAEVQARYGDLEQLHRQAEQAARQAQQGVFGYPGGIPQPAPEMQMPRPAGGPVIIEMPASASAGGSAAPAAAPAAPHPTPSQDRPRAAGPIITEVE